jgi:putative tryptophan/tyrosine transport system substrate-binding protein
VRRRGFIALLGAAAAWPLSLPAQQPKMATIGILATGNQSPETFLQEFRLALRTAGRIEGQNIRLEVRSAEGSDTLLPQKATELVRLNVDVIVAILTPAVEAARNATTDIRIVMAAAGDPVATGLVSSLARPGGNITGVSGAALDTAGKRLELIRELLPSVRRVAALANETDPFALALVAQLG